MYKEELWQACPMNAANNVNGIGDCPRDDILVLKHKDLLDIQIAFTKKIVSELRDFDNLYYEVCNEPYTRRSSLAWQYKIVDAIVETEKQFANKHLISMNIANGRKKIEETHPAVSIFNFHYCVPPDTVAMNYGLNKVIGENETGFRGSHDVLYRTEGWDFLLAGGALYNNLDYSFTPAHPRGTFLEYKSPGGGNPSLRQQLRILKQFLHSFDFVRMTPDNSVLGKVSPALTASALVERGKAYAVYLHVPLPEKPKDLRKHLRKAIEANLELNLPAGRYKAEWVDTKEGTVALVTEFSHDGGNHTLNSPTFSNDIALRVIRLRNL